ncbi:MAG: prepilin-type N-terminal cleavage/methylation domain-containing protein [Syntrophomonadaceae bacterium]|jgi:prepilin-type N-terminal cleavage/methylation domain-containing protein|nr:prepilin-type N-terminal cleavage/methylation domain-containing protein [Syntrophomonadaceae bacterium]
MAIINLERKQANERGFTLIELVIVMAILAIIAAIAVPRYLNFLADAQQKAVVSDQAMIERAVELCLALDDESSLLVNQYKSAKAITDALPLIPNYLKTVPVDPDGKAYILEIKGDGTTGYDIVVSQDTSST